MSSSFRILWAVLAVALAPLHAEEPKPQWKDANTHELKRVKVTLSEPILVARSKGYLWFPTLHRLSDGGLLAVMSDYEDAHVKKATAKAAWSRDGGLSWSETKPALYGDVGVTLPDGDRLLLPYYLYPRKDGMGGPCQIVPKGKQETRDHGEMIVTGWPRPDQSPAPQLGISGFVTNGQVVKLKDGSHLMTLYGNFKGTKRYALVAAESNDGLTWKIRSTIADETCKLAGAEGPCESALCRLKDGRLMCLFRNASNVPYGQVWSNDEGKTWTQPVATRADVHSVQPSLAVMPDGMVVLSGGRPGLFAWVNTDGTGKDWQAVDIKANHNACVPKEQIGAVERTSSYTEVVPLDETHLLYIYDRIPNGWRAIPKDSAETNSVWVVRLTLTK